MNREFIRQSATILAGGLIALGASTINNSFANAGTAIPKCTKLEAYTLPLTDSDKLKREIANGNVCDTGGMSGISYRIKIAGSESVRVCTDAERRALPLTPTKVRRVANKLGAAGLCQVNGKYLTTYRQVL